MSCYSYIVSIVFYTYKRYPNNTECQLIFGFKLSSAIIADKTKRFLMKYDSVNNLLFKLSRLMLVRSDDSLSILFVSLCYIV